MTSVDGVEMPYFRLRAPGRFVAAPAPQDEPGPDVPVDFVAGTICGSDLPKYLGRGPVTYPLPLGGPLYECLGRTAAATRDGLPAGTPVVAMPTDDRGLGPRFHAARDRLVPIPEDLAGDWGSCLVQPLATVLAALERLPSLPERATVIGLGPIGLLCGWVLTRRGVQVHGIDPVPLRCRAARTLGFAGTVTDTADQVEDGAELVVEAVGHQQATIGDAIRMCRPKGVVLAMGVPDDQDYVLPYEQYFRRNLTMIASVTPEWAVWLPAALLAYLDGAEDLRPLVTHVIPLRTVADVERAYGLAVERTRAVKVCVTRPGTGGR